MITLLGLLEEYKAQIKICYTVDYNDKKSIKANNEAVDRIYEIVEIIKDDFGDKGIKEVSTFLDITTNKTNLWVAIQLLEKLPVDEIIKKKAFSIIENAAKGSGSEALGFQGWLLDWKKKYGK